MRAIPQQVQIKIAETLKGQTCHFTDITLKNDGITDIFVEI